MRNEHATTTTWDERGQVKAVVNSVAAERLRDDHWLERLERDLGVGILRTEGPGDAPSLTRAALADGCRTLLVAGGDGSVNEVVNALGDDARHVLLGIIPIGTGNDLATALGMPTDPEEAIDALKRARGKWIDTVQVSWKDGGRLAVNACTAGFSALVDDNLDPRRKELLGGLAYLPLVRSRYFLWPTSSASTPSRTAARCSTFACASRARGWRTSNCWRRTACSSAPTTRSSPTRSTTW